ERRVIPGLDRRPVVRPERLRIRYRRSVELGHIPRRRDLGRQDVERPRKRFPSALTGLVDLLGGRRHLGRLVGEHGAELVAGGLDASEHPGELLDRRRVLVRGETQVVLGLLEYPRSLGGLLPLLMYLPE